MFPSLQQAAAQILDNSYVVFLPLWIFAWVLMLISGNALVHWLKNLRGMKWSPREDTPDSHLQKAGTPSMGGLGIIGAATLSLLVADTLCVVLSFIADPGFFPGYDKSYLLTDSAVILCVLAFCGLGFADDWSKARGKGGLTSKAKLVGQIVFSLALLLAVRYLLLKLSSVFGEGFLYFAPLSFLFCFLLIIGTSNAVNITDGIDGLAAGLSVQVGLVFGVLFFETIATTTPGFFALSAESVWLCLGGACLGFLAFNKHPAKMIMGDTGSLALGAALGAGAILTRSVFLLPFIGFMFFIEMFSVIAQVGYFKYTKKRTGEGKRLLRRAPLHHHFELAGWSEWRVVGTFWVINAFTTGIGLILWKAGILPRFP